MGSVKLVIARPDTTEAVYSQQQVITFADPLAQVRVLFRIRDLSFPEAGLYLVTLLVDDEWVAQQSILVHGP